VPGTQLIGWKRAILPTRRAAFFVCHFRAISESHRQILFLGIDHSAIVVSDTEASVRFYRDLLGMSVAGESENYGTQQEHPNNVFGARLRITALRSAGCPGIELLEYLAPRDGRPFPSDEHANDLAHRQTMLVTHDADSAGRRIYSAKIQFASSGVIANQPGFSRAFVVRDPDGHAIEIEQK
jgi:catechol 2,3-dioxygenase-like lactoylglutathione lyase family enzyme